MDKKRVKMLKVVLLALMAVGISTTVYGALKRQSIEAEVSTGVSVWVNGSEIAMDDAGSGEIDAFIYNGVTYLPVRTLAQALGKNIEWDGENAMVHINDENREVNQSNKGNSEDRSVVYMTTDISPEGLMAVYEALGRTPHGNVAVKLSTGEPGNTHYLSPDLIKDFVQRVNGTIVECNTAYGGGRANTAMHYQVAEDHGFTAIAPVVILDENGSISLPVTNGKHLAEDLVGAHFSEYDFHVVLNHFKGHAMGGFGGALKNMSIGYASSEGKVNIHSAGTSRTSWGSPAQDDFLESMSEAAKAVVDAAGKENFLYISVMNHLSVDCDCDGNPAAPDMHDIGILASLDPVALDKACVDLVYQAPDGASLIERMESRNGIRTVDYAAEIGLGNLEYELVSID